MRVGLCGAGERLDALGTLVGEAGNEVVPGGVDGCDVTFVDVPVGDLRATIRELAPGPSARLVLVTRGLESPGGKRLSQVVEEESACLRVGALAGPILAGEVRRRSPCAAVVASSFAEVTRAAGAALHSGMCRVYPSEDLAGVELSGALVEVVAAAIGAARGLGMGVGLQALVVTRGIAEGGRLTARVGGDARTFAGLAGAGELVACVSLPDHPGQQRGLALARGEADPALAELCDALLARCRDLPITTGVREVARGRAKVADAMAALLHREQRDERA